MDDTCIPSFYRRESCDFSHERLQCRYVASDDFIFKSGTVKTVGRKYITVQIDRWNSVQFDILNDFHEKTDYAQSYWLFPDKESAVKMIQRRKIIRELRQMPDMWKHFSDRELELANEFLLERNPPSYCASCTTESYVITAFGCSEENALLNLKSRCGEVAEGMDMEAFRKSYDVDIFPVSCNSGNVRKI